MLITFSETLCPLMPFFFYPSFLYHLFRVRLHLLLSFPPSVSLFLLHCPSSFLLWFYTGCAASFHPTTCLSSSFSVFHNTPPYSPIFCPSFPRSVNRRYACHDLVPVLYVLDAIVCCLKLSQLLLFTVILIALFQGSQVFVWLGESSLRGRN